MNCGMRVMVCGKERMVVVCGKRGIVEGIPGQCDEKLFVNVSKVLSETSLLAKRSCSRSFGSKNEAIVLRTSVGAVRRVCFDQAFLSVVGLRLWET